MKKILLIVFLLGSSWCNAQNYQCLQANVKHYFTNSVGYLRGIRVDSVKTYADSILFYPYHTPRGINYTSWDPPELDTNGGSWLGKKVIRLNDGTFLFDNLWNDTVVIKTQASVGDNWIFFRDTSATYYSAELYAQDTMTILGILDSVKKIRVIAHNSLGVVTTDPADSIEIFISQNHGFVQVCDLYTFPYRKPDTVYGTGLDYYLDVSTCNIILPLPALLSPPLRSNGLNRNTITFKLIAYSVPSNKDLYKWNIGDLYQYTYSTGLNQYTNSIGGPFDKYWTDSVVDTNNTTTYNKDSVVGLFAHFRPNAGMYPYDPPYHYNVGPWAGSLIYDTSRAFSLDLMPEEFLQTQIHYYIPNDTVQFCVPGAIYAYTNSEIYYDQYSFRFEGPFTTYVYKSPLGLINYYKISADAGYFIGGNTLVYCVRNGVACGSYHSFDTTADTPSAIVNINKGAPSFTIFPNPTDNEISITSVEKIGQITITDVLGTTLYSINCNMEKMHINLYFLPKGLYFVRINESHVLKLIKL